MKATAIIGANYGDEGKGLMTDYICAREGADLVVRFNGGAQAGHTVVTPDGKRHVFHTYGSGTFCDVPTYLSQFFIFNPIMWAEERRDLMQWFGLDLVHMFAHPMCAVTTPYDMLLNQLAEMQRDGFEGRHGSCGVGIFETIRRHCEFPLHFYENGPASLILERIKNEYVPKRLAELGLEHINLGSTYDLRAIDRDFVRSWGLAKTKIGSCTLTQALHYVKPKHIAFEGAQGLLLDKDAPGYPHLTPSKTGLHNVRVLCDEIQLPLDQLTAIYVSRTYLTRHGAGPLPRETNRPEWLKDDTNLDTNPWQQRLRYAPLVDTDDLWFRGMDDADFFGERHAGDVRFALTHWDQHELKWPHGRLRYVSKGPSRNDVLRLED